MRRISEREEADVDLAPAVDADHERRSISATMAARAATTERVTPHSNRR
jgi:hypothetical protein